MRVDGRVYEGRIQPQNSPYPFRSGVFEGHWVVYSQSTALLLAIALPVLNCRT